MKRLAAAAALTIAVAVLTIAQAPSQPEPAGPDILNVLPVTDNLDRAEEFYHRLLGLESPQGDPRARLVWYPQVPFLDDMYGVKGNTRNFFLRIPGSDLNLEIEQFSAAKGKRLDTHVQDPGAVQFIFTVNNIDLLTDWLTKGGAKVLSAGGKPVSMTGEDGTTRAILFQDFNGFFVKLVQPDGPPPAPGEWSPAQQLHNRRDRRPNRRGHRKDRALSITTCSVWMSKPVPRSPATRNKRQPSALKARSTVRARSCSPRNPLRFISSSSRAWTASHCTRWLPIQIPC